MIQQIITFSIVGITVFIMIWKMIGRYLILPKILRHRMRGEFNEALRLQKMFRLPESSCCGDSCKKTSPPL